MEDNTAAELDFIINNLISDAFSAKSLKSAKIMSGGVELITLVCCCSLIFESSIYVEEDGLLVVSFFGSVFKYDDKFICSSLILSSGGAI